MNKITCVLGFLLITALVGCNLPESQTPQSPDAAFTSAAKTVQVELTRIALQASPTLTAPPPTLTSIPTNTSLPSPSNTLIPCNKALFITDVTIPDNMTIPMGQSFTKTWRLRNDGTCTWSSGYLLVFDHGDGMGVPTGYAQALTSGMVLPGQDLDVTVNLTAPMTSGTYTGYWRFRDPGGEPFTLFKVVIKVPAGTSHSVTISSTETPGENGTVRADGHVTTTELIPGDTSTNLGLQLFLAFDISGIPSNATINEVKFDLSNNTVYGNPFTNLGCLKAYPVNYVTTPTPTSGDYIFGTAPGSEDHEWCSAAVLATPVADNDFRIALQTKIGSARLRYRLQLNTQTNSDNNADAVSFSQVKLLVTYTTP
jgi:hypothetical protein